MESVSAGELIDLVSLLVIIETNCAFFLLIGLVDLLLFKIFNLLLLSRLRAVVIWVVSQKLFNQLVHIDAVDISGHWSEDEVSESDGRLEVDENDARGGALLLSLLLLLLLLSNQLFLLLLEKVLFSLIGSSESFSLLLDSSFLIRIVDSKVFDLVSWDEFFQNSIAILAENVDKVVFLLEFWLFLSADMAEIFDADHLVAVVLEFGGIKIGDHSCKLIVEFFFYQS